MAKRRVKKTVKNTESLPKANGSGANEPREPQVETQQTPFIHLEAEFYFPLDEGKIFIMPNLMENKTLHLLENGGKTRLGVFSSNFNSFCLAVERQVAAIRAVRDVEVEHLLTELRLLRSYLSKEQLQTPVLQFFEGILPNLSVVNDKENKQFEVRWNDKDNRLSMSYAEGRDVHASLLQRLSMAFPDCSAAVPPLGGFEHSSKAGRTSFLGSDNLHIKDFEASEAQTLAMQEALLTPGVSCQRLSVGMTPKTLRLPKLGEMLLSVHGSPLGVYKENNMEAIHESEEC